jgi:hypothetical protein
MTEWGSPTLAQGLFAAAQGGREEKIELIGPHLRVSGTISLGRFNRLTDLVNHSRGYVQLKEGRLLRRNGDPTSLVVSNLMVNQDEITFIGQQEHALASAPTEEIDPDSILTGDRPQIEKAPRRFVIFTPGHAITGSIFVHAEMTLANFVDASDPRFIAMTAVSARSLADRRVISHFEFLLVNRTQMTAIAEFDRRVTVHEDVAEAATS